MSQRMFGRKSAVVGGVAAALLASAGSAIAAPKAYELGMQAAALPVMERIESFHTLLLYIIIAISIFVAILMGWILVRYNRRSNPVPSKTHHNTLLEVAWTIFPEIIKNNNKNPTKKQHKNVAEIPQADVHIKVIGKQWYW